jgi:hypothetical protein
MDVLHEVVAFHRQCCGGRKIDGRSIVDHDVDAAECFSGALHRFCHAVFGSHVSDDREGLAASVGDFAGGIVDCSGQLGIGLVGFGDHGDVGAVAGRPQRDGQPDASASAGHDDCLSRN